MSSSSSSSPLKKVSKIVILFEVVMMLVSLGMGIWSAYILGQVSRSVTTDQIFGYVVMECVVNFLRIFAILSKLLNQGQNNACSNFVQCAGTASGIWNMVILFSQVGVENYKLNEYTYYVFVQFVMNMSMIGLAIILCTGACVGVGILLCCEKTVASKEQPKQQESPTNPPTDPIEVKVSV
jgi:hypothetical protein